MELLRLRSRVVILLLALVAGPLVALEVPPAPTQWVTDRAGILSPAEAGALNDKLAAFEQESGAQFIIYTLPSLEGDAVEDFTIRAVDKWKVGQAKYDNGLVLFVFRDDRKMRVETGYGLEGTITDAFASRVIREHIAPHFAQGQWAAGLNAGADALMAQIRKGEAPVEPLRTGRAPDQPPAFSSVLFLLILFAIMFFILPMMSRRRGGCGGCILPMMFFPGGGGGVTFGGHRGGFGGGGFGGFSGGGGGFGGGGATGGW